MELCREKLEEYFKDVRKMKSPQSNSFTYMSSIKILKEFIDKNFGGVNIDKNTKNNEDENIALPLEEEDCLIPKPCIYEIEKYLKKWDGLENYTVKENALEKLFNRTYPKNTEIEDVLIKVSSLNDFYSTNIFSPFTVAKQITQELKEFPSFKDILINFRRFYGLEDYSLKDIDRYLWQLGKEKFPNKY